MLNIKSLLNKIVTTVIFKTGVTMTGEILTSFKNNGINFRAFGFYNSQQHTIPDLITELRYSSGAFGTIAINSPYYSPNNTNKCTILSGNYVFLYMPHRSGGSNGAANGDNTNYGNLLLIERNFIVGRRKNEPGVFILLYNNGSITNGYRIRALHKFSGINTEDISAASIGVNQFTNSYYSMNLSTSKVEQMGPFVTATLYIQCNTVSSSWQQMGIIGPITQNTTYCGLTNSAATTLEVKIDKGISYSEIWCRGGKAGHGFEGTITYVT